VYTEPGATVERRIVYKRIELFTVTPFRPVNQKPTVTNISSPHLRPTK